jgi:hypothetical protein
MLSANEIASMTSTVASSLDISLPLYRKTVTQDGYGHSIETYPSTPTSTIQCNVIKPTATQLQTFADIIAGQKALLLRYMPSSDVREGDRFVYQGQNWKVQPTESAESYTFANEVLIVTVS